MFDTLQDFVAMHETAIAAVAAIIAAGAGVFCYGRYHERRMRSRRPGLTG